MSEYSCQVRNLGPDALSGFHDEKEALSAGGFYLNPDANGWVDAAGRTGLCIVCENCGAIVEDVPPTGELDCPACGESTFRVLQTFRLVTITNGFSARWHRPWLWVAIDVPNQARNGMAAIRYTVDGSDPNWTSPVYEGPIPYRKEMKPIRAAVFYHDARSQIIEWDYGRAERNRDRIRKQSGSADGRPTKPPRRRTKPKSAPPSSSPRRTPPTPPPIRIKPPDESTKPKDKNKGCGCLMILAMGIGGVALIFGEKIGVGLLLAGIAVLATIGMFKDN